MRLFFFGILMAGLSGALPAADMHQRFARLALAQGRVQVENGATGERLAGERNLALGQGFWLETADGARAEVELDEGGTLRLGPGSLAELSDLTRLSTGQRITLVSLERGTLYVTAQPAGLDAFAVVAPGLQVTFLAGSRVRLEAGPETSAVAILEGRVRFTSAVAELDLGEGHTVRVDPKADDRFQLFREVIPAALDRWNEQADKEAATRAAGTKVAAFPFGLGELDAQGAWIEVSGAGKGWKPRVAEGWAPFRSGRWVWCSSPGWVWVSGEPWGWLPYHFGRWTEVAGAGWVWIPGGEEGQFHGGAAYWLRSATYVGWGPLGPGEEWRGQSAPSLYSAARTSFAAYEAGARVVDPARAPRLPRDPMVGAEFAAGLPGPPPEPALASARRRRTRVGTTRVLPIAGDIAYGGRRVEGGGTTAPAEGIRVIGAEPEPAPPASPPSGVTYYYTPAPPPSAAPPAEPALIYQPAPVYYPGVVVVESPRYERGGRSGGGRGGGGGPHGPPAVRPPALAPPAPAAPPPAATPPPSRPRETPAPRESPRTQEGPDHVTRIRTPEGGEGATRRR